MTRLLICFCAIALLVPTAASASPRLGIEAGSSLVWTEIGTDGNFEGYDPGSRFDFNAAATLHFALNRTWGLTAGVRYSRLGEEAKVDGVRTANEPYGNGTSLSGTVSTEIQYLGIPLFARLKFTGDHGPYLFGGAEIAWLLDATRKLSLSGGSSFEGDEAEADVSRYYKSYNATAVLGAGLDLDLAGHSLEFALRFGYGLVDIGDHDEFLASSVKEKTRELAFTVGFRF